MADAEKSGSEERDGRVKSLENGVKHATKHDEEENDDEILDFFVQSNDGDAKKKKRKRKGLPKWLDHFNAKDLKVLFKCSVAVWILTIFIFIDATLRAIGQAAFFGWYTLSPHYFESAAEANT